MSRKKYGDPRAAHMAAHAQRNERTADTAPARPASSAKPAADGLHFIRREYGEDGTLKASS